MRQVSIQDLKRDLSGILSEAAEGDPVLVTRHGKPLVELTAARLRHVTVGERYGKANLEPLLRLATKGRYLVLLAEDRRGGPDR